MFRVTQLTRAKQSFRCAALVLLLVLEGHQSLASERAYRGTLVVMQNNAEGRDTFVTSAVLVLSKPVLVTQAPNLEVGTPLALAGKSPFEFECDITFTVPSDGRVGISAWDLSGRLVCNVFEGSVAAGKHTRRWRGVNQEGKRIGSGVYFLKMSHPSGTRTTRVIALN